MPGALADVVYLFNHELRLLISDLAARYPRDATIARTAKRAALITRDAPIYVVETVGPFLYRYREKIYALDSAGGAGAAGEAGAAEAAGEASAAEAFFLDTSFDDEVRAGAPDRVRDVAYIILKTKECARGMTRGEKQGYFDAVVALLDCYVDYVAAKAGEARRD